MRPSHKLCILGLLLSAVMAAQSTLTLSGPASVRPGGTLSLNLSLTSTAANPIAGIHWVLAPPAGYTATGLIGAAGTSSGKTLYCVPGDLRCLIIGINQNPLTNGVVATYSIHVPSSASAGLVSLPLSTLFAGNASGVDVPLVSGTAYSFRVIPKTDVNGDGSINSADVLLMIDQALGKTACTADQNDDSQCRLIDVLMVIFAIPSIQ